MRGLNHQRRMQPLCAYCGYPGATMRGGVLACFAHRDLPALERAGDAEVELLISAYYEGNRPDRKQRTVAAPDNT